MKSKIFPLIIVLFYVFFVSELSCAKSDVKGWGNSEWNMSEPQVLKVHPEAKKLNDSKYPDIKLQIKNVSINNDLFNVNFIFNKMNQLKEVVLSPGKKVHTDGLFLGLERMLTNKYGPPSLRNKSISRLAEGIELESSWSFPSTSIELSYVGGSLGFLKIHYKSSDRSTSDKL